MTRQKTTTDLHGEKITYWRSIDNRRRTKEYLEYLHDEFAPDISDITHVDRRSMLKFMGASLALAGLGVSCRRPEEKILPYVKAPLDITPGIANYFATSQSSPFGASGLLVESHEGRPTKIEGNPTHPQNLGKASFINQASVLELYDPDRSKFCMQTKAGDHMPVSLEDLDSFLFTHFTKLADKKGEGLAFLCDLDISPTFLRLKAEIKKRFSGAKFYTHEPLRRINTENAEKISFGSGVKVKYDFSKAKLLLSLFADPFSFGPDHLNLQRGFSQNRKMLSPEDKNSLNRFYAVEADYSLTGGNADHRLRLPFGLAKKFVEALAYELHANHGMDIDPKIFSGAKSFSTIVPKPITMNGIDKNFLRILAKDLALHKGKALIFAGDHLPSSVISMVHAINASLDGLNKTFSLLKIDSEITDHLVEPDIKVLTESIKKKEVDTLFIVGTNPVFTAPRDLNFSESLKQVSTSIHLGLYRDETAHLCTWHIPQTHFLEHFADDISFDGTVSLVQPLIKPLFASKTKLQILAQIANIKENNPRDLVKSTFIARFGALANFDKSLHDGFIAATAFKNVDKITFNTDQIFKNFSNAKTYNPSKDKPEFILSFDRKILDGRYANHGWLQELPDAVTRINWGNALLMSPLMAKELSLKSGLKKNAYVADVMTVTFSGKSLQLPVFVMPGLSDYSLVINLGYGRKNAGEIGNGVGVDVYDFYSGSDKLVLENISLAKTDKQFKISTTQEQFAMNADTVQEIETFSMQSRDPARDTNLKDYLKNPKAAGQKELLESLLTKEKGKEKKVPMQITDPWDYSKGNQWGMSIDLSMCTGCNACVLACQSENNIPVVGKDQVIRGRMMHWIRIDRYFTGDVKDPKTVVQPVVCQHCENAPCEPVCPVAATSHDREGLNVMTYNRCIGTRYCANNCPFKVRRFNYFDYTKTGDLHVAKNDQERQQTLKMQRNPDVTVRYRGVMEKCTYCTQRIQEAKMKARREGRDQENLPDGAVIPACAQTCPSDAITFGNINDKTSNVYKLKNVDRSYTMLDILNIRPRTSYLSKIRNPHPDLVA